jgi:hypothetical protein
MWKFLSKIFKPNRWKVQASPSCIVDDSGFREVDADGTEKVILWSDLENVDILTTSNGPFFEDFFYILRGKGTYICIDQFKAEQLKLLNRFERLPGFKWDQVVRAATSVVENSFACWDRNWEPASPRREFTN